MYVHDKHVTQSQLGHMTNLVSYVLTYTRANFQVAMGSVMLAIFVLEGITAIVASALCCHAVCCCRGSQVSSYYVIQMTNFNKKLALSALIF